VGEGIAFELLSAGRHALALDIDRKHHGFDFLALLEVAYSGFARLRPRQVRQVNETVDATRQSHKNAEIGDRLDLALHLVALLVIHRKLVPRILTALLIAERDAAELLVGL